MLRPQDLHLRDEDRQSGRWGCRRLQVRGDGQRQVWQLHLWSHRWGWVKTDCGLLRLTRVPCLLMCRSDPGLICRLCNFSHYSCTARGAGGYFVCLQESVSALGFVFQPVSVVYSHMCIRRLIMIFPSVCMCVCVCVFVGVKVFYSTCSIRRWSL